MIKVTINGWHDGLNKVQLNHLLRQYAGYGLGEAKRAVDELLTGESLTFDSPDPESATAFCLSARAINAVCESSAEARELESGSEKIVRKTAS